ncbi:ROK family protein [Oerskovia flava]|uniref:ROK family protein n=1 Tax=Oerskovia flava TaxID=2986422 RepID=UPI0022403623|nr:ROK family protein [Oerskovia sp. JB1-3-2]
MGSTTTRVAAAPTTGSGRRGAAHRAVAGVDIGGTSTSAVVVSGAGEVLATARRRTPAQEGGAAMSRAAAEVVRAALRDAGGGDAGEGRIELVGVGVGAAGVIDPTTGAVLAASDSFHDWVGHPLVAELEAALAVGVVVENDVNAFVSGERAHGAVSGVDDVLGITLGTGVGGALVLDGTLRRGPHGGAGEIGHVPGFGDLPCTCGQRGHLETLASGLSIARRYAERRLAHGMSSPPEGWTAAEVAARARSGDLAARAVVEEAGLAVGCAAVMVATLVDVTEVVVGGGVAQAWDLLAPAIRRGIDARPPVSGAEVRVHRSSLGADAVALGAAAVAAARIGV